MTALTNEEVLQWCTERHLLFDRWQFLHFGPGSTVLEVPFPNVAHKAPPFASLLCELLKEFSPFQSLLLWVKETGIFSDRWDEIGLRQLELERIALGERRSLSDSPGHLFHPKEELDVIGMSVLPMLYGWDAYLIPDSARLFAYISHDEYVHVGFHDPALEPVLMEQCKMWNPQRRVVEFFSAEAGQPDI